MFYGAKLAAIEKGFSGSSGACLLFPDKPLALSAASFCCADRPAESQPYNMPSDFIKYQPKSAFIAAFYYGNLCRNRLPADGRSHPFLLYAWLSLFF